MTLLATLDDNFLGSAGDSFAGDSQVTIVNGGSRSLVAHYYGVAVRMPAGVVAALAHTLAAPTTGPILLSLILTVSANPTAAAQIIQVRTSSGALCTISISTTGKIRVGNTTSTASGNLSTNSIPLGTPFRLDIGFTGTTATAKIYSTRNASSVLETVTNASVTGGTVAEVRLGNPNAGGTVGADVDIAWPQLYSSLSDTTLRRFVKLVLDKTSGYYPVAVSATVTAEDFPGVGTLAYSIDWGDGNTEGPQAGGSFSHTFTGAGAFSVQATAVES